jgi:hypothetical protein
MDGVQSFALQVAAAAIGNMVAIAALAIAVWWWIA